jgi:hypothetical protein
VAGESVCPAEQHSRNQKQAAFLAKPAKGVKSAKEQFPGFEMSLAGLVRILAPWREIRLKRRSHHNFPPNRQERQEPLGLSPRPAATSFANPPCHAPKEIF